MSVDQQDLDQHAAESSWQPQPQPPVQSKKRHRVRNALLIALAAFSVLIIAVAMSGTSTSTKSSAPTATQPRETVPAPSPKPSPEPSIPSTAKRVIEWWNTAQGPFETWQEDHQKLAADLADPSALMLDPSDAISHAEAAADDIEALQDLAPLPSKKIRMHWQSALNNYRLSYTTLVLGLRTMNTDAINLSNEQMQEGTAEINKATAAVEDLAS